MCNSHFSAHKKSFTGLHLSNFPYVLPIVALTLQWQSWVWQIQRGPESLKYLQFGLLQKSFIDLCCKATPFMFTQYKELRLKIAEKEIVPL